MEARQDPMTQALRAASDQRRPEALSEARRALAEAQWQCLRANFGCYAAAVQVIVTHVWWAVPRAAYLVLTHSDQGDYWTSTAVLDPTFTTLVDESVWEQGGGDVARWWTIWDDALSTIPSACPMPFIVTIENKMVLSLSAASMWLVDAADEVVQVGQAQGLTSQA